MHFSFAVSAKRSPKNTLRFCSGWGEEGALARGVDLPPLYQSLYGESVR